MSRFLPLFLLLACSGKSDLDTASPMDSGPNETDDPYTFECEDEDLEVDPLGPSEPVVGDEWTVWLRCNGTTLTGTMVLQVDPAEFASIEENVVTFLMAGTAEMTVTVGAYRATMDITVVNPE